MEKYYRRLFIGALMAIGLGAITAIAYAAQPVFNSAQIGLSPMPGYIPVTNGQITTWTNPGSITASSTYSRAATKVVCASNATDIINCDYHASATSSDVAIQQALNALPNGGEVLLSNGIFTLSNTAFITASGTLITGSGVGGTTLKAASGLATPILQSNTKLQNVVIENLKFDGSNASTTSGTADDFEGFDLRNSIIQNNWFTGAPNEGIYLNGDANLGWYNVVQNNDIDHNGDGTNFRFDEYSFVNNNAYSFNTNYGAISQSDSDSFYDNSFDEDTTGLYMEFNSGNNKITNNAFTRFTNWGILLRQTQQNTITGNQFDSVPSGYAAIQNGEFGTEARSQINVANNYTTGNSNSGSCGYSEVSSTTGISLVGNNFVNTANPYCLNASSTQYTILDYQQLNQFGTTTLSGISYTWPTVQGGANQFLQNNGAGKLNWSTVSAANSSSTYTTVCASGCTYTATGTNDQVGINAAIGAVNAAGGGTVLIKKGNYSLSGTISVLSNIVLTGEGNGTFISVGSNGNGSLSASGTVNSTIENMRFDGTGQSRSAFNGDIGIRVKNSSNVTVANNTFQNMYGYSLFISSEGFFGATTTNVNVTNNTMTCEALQDCIGGGPGDSSGQSTTSDVTILNNIITQTTFGGGVLNSNMDANCVDMVAVLRMNFSNNHCFGDLVFGNEQAPNKNSVIRDNIIDSPLGPVNVSGEVVFETSGGTTSASTNTPVGLSVLGNSITHGGIFLSGNGNNSFTNLLVANNNIQTATSSAQHFRSAENGIEGSNIINSLITGNTIVAFPASTAKGIVISGTATNDVYSNNTINGFATGLDMGSGSGSKDILNTYLSNSVNVVNVANTLTFNNSGYVGIGTVTPLTTLDVNGSIRATGQVSPSNATGTELTFDGTTGNLRAYSRGASTYVPLAVDGNPLELNANSTSNVGIGTSTPGQPLVVVGSTTLTSLIAGTVCATATGGLYVGCSSGGGGGSSGGFGTSSPNNVFTNFPNTTSAAVGVNTTTPSAQFTVEGTSGTTTPIFKVASSSNNSDLVVLSNGNVGIGTAAPVNAFQINNGATPGGSVPTGLGLQVNGTGTANRFMVASGNKVAYFQAGGTGVQADAEFSTYDYGNSSGLTLWVNANGGNVEFGSADTVANQITDHGDFSVGTGYINNSAPINGAIIQGRTGVGTNAPNSMLMVQGASGTTSPTFIVASSSGSSVLQINSSGNIGIGTTTPAYGLVAAGTVQLPGIATTSSGLSGYLCTDANNQVVDDTAVCVTVSAARYKQNINPLTSGLTQLMKLTPVSFNFKPDTGMTSNLQYGLIADDVAKVDPNLVVYTSTTTKFEDKIYPTGTPQGLAPDNTWFGFFTKAMQDIEGQIQSIFTRLAGDENKINSLQSQIATQQVEINSLEAAIKSTK